jgi:hypothetical protein
LPVVLCGCEAWFLTSREHRIEMPESRVSRKIFELKRNEVIGGWRKFNSDELHCLCSSPNEIIMIKSRRIKCAAHVTYMTEKFM